VGYDGFWLFCEVKNGVQEKKTRFNKRAKSYNEINGPRQEYSN
jgi:hypothetical protein